MELTDDEDARERELKLYEPLGGQPQRLLALYLWWPPRSLGGTRSGGHHIARHLRQPETVPGSRPGATWQQLRTRLGAGRGPCLVSVKLAALSGTSITGQCQAWPARPLQPAQPRGFCPYLLPAYMRAGLYVTRQLIAEMENSAADAEGLDAAGEPEGRFGTAAFRHNPLTFSFLSELIC
jgi:hypothetical protein